MDRKEFLQKFTTPNKVLGTAAAGIIFALGKADYTTGAKTAVTLADTCRFTFEESERGKQVMKKDEKLVKKNSPLAKEVQLPLIKKSLAREDIWTYITTSFENSDLPLFLKKLGPYIVRQESKGSRTIESGSGAKGLWQFMPDTAKAYNIKDRTNPKQSTRGAIKYLKKIHKDLKSCKGFQQIHQRYDTYPEEQTHLVEHVLPLLTINAYNSGEGHMTRALEKLAERPNELKKYHHKKGGAGGVFERVTKEYANGYAELQEHKPYYHHESSAYVYQIMHRYLLDTQDGVGEEQTPRQTSYSKEIAGLLTSSFLGYFAYQNFKQKPLIEKGISRRTFLKSSATGAGGGLLLYALSRIGISDTLGSLVPTSLPREDTTVSNEELFKDYTPELGHIKDIYFDRIKQGVYDKENKGILKKDITYMITMDYYLMDQHIADIARELEKDSKESTLAPEELTDDQIKKYKRLAATFYHKALSLSEKQRVPGSGLRLPPGGLPEVEERITYCTTALAALEEE